MESSIRRVIDGILFAEFSLKTGEERPVVFENDAQRVEIDSVAVYVDGAFTVYDDKGEPFARRTPGDVSSEKLPVPKGRFRIVADAGGGRYICLFPAQSARVFKHQVVRASAGECFHLLPGRVYFLAIGKVEIGGAIREEKYTAKVSSQEIVARAETDILMISMWRD